MRDSRRLISAASAALSFSAEERSNDGVELPDTLDKLLPNGTHMMMVAPDGTELKALAVYPDGSITAGRIDISAGMQHQMVVTTVLTGRVVLR